VPTQSLIILDTVVVVMTFITLFNCSGDQYHELRLLCYSMVESMWSVRQWKVPSRLHSTTMLLALQPCCLSMPHQRLPLNIIRSTFISTSHIGIISSTSVVLLVTSWLFYPCSSKTDQLYLRTKNFCYFPEKSIGRLE